MKNFSVLAMLAILSTSLLAQSGKIVGNGIATGNGEVAAPQVGSATLQSIVVTPSSPSIANGSAQQFTATGLYSDGTFHDVTATAVWTSANTGIAQVVGGSPIQQVNAVGVGGPVAIKATVGSIFGLGSITVTGPAPTLVSIALTPASVSTTNGTTVSYTALGTYSDSTTGDVTAIATWNSSSPSVASIGALTVGPPASQAVLCGNPGSGTSNISANVGAVVSPNSPITCNALPPPSIASNYTCPLAGGGVDATAALPLSYVCSSEADTPRVSPTTVTVPVGGNLQTAYNSAPCGADIQLAPLGTFTLPTPSGKGCAPNNWVWIETAPSSHLPAEGVTTNPCYSNTSSLSDYPAFSPPCGATLGPYTATITVPPGGEINANGIDHVRFKNLHIKKTTGGIVYELLNLTSAKHVVVDRVWFSGLPGEEVAHGILEDGASGIAVVDSIFTNITCIAVSGSCTDSQNIQASTAPGPFKNSHNVLSASGEQIMYGGGGFAFGINSDIEISFNRAFKPFSWNPGCVGGICPGAVNYNGGTGGHPYCTKNNLELKNAQRVVVFGNQWQNNWGGCSQVGNSITFSPKNQAAGANNLCPGCKVQDVTERYDRSSYFGMALQLFNGANGNGAYAAAGQRYSFHDVVFDHWNYPGCTVCSNYMNYIYSPSNLEPLNGLFLNHLTFVMDPAATFNGTNALGLWGPVSPLQGSMTLQNSILPSGAFGMGNIGGGAASCAFGPAASLAKFVGCFSPVSFTKNGIPFGSGTSCGTPPTHGCGGAWDFSAWLATHSYAAGGLVVPVASNGHFYVNTAGACTSGGVQPTWSISGGSVSDGSCTWLDRGVSGVGGQILTADQTTVGYVNLIGGNYQLQLSSPFLGQGTDGFDLGISNWVTFNYFQANVAQSPW